MKLFELIAANPHLQYIDPGTDQSCRPGDFYRSLDIPPGRGLVFLYLDNRIDSVEVLLNFLQHDYALALLSPGLNRDFKKRLEQRYRPAFICDPARSDIAGFDILRLSPGVTLFKNTVESGYEVHSAIRLLLSTSGSTGSPKFVKLSENNLIRNARSIQAYLPVSHTDVTPLNLPLYYSYGLSVFTTNAIAGGQIVCTGRDVLQKEFWEEWSRYGYTSLSGVPYVYEMLHRIGFCKKAYPSLRYMTQAGGKLDRNLLQAFGEYAARHDIRFFVMYGQTEATARMSYLPPEDLSRKAGSIGKPVPGGRFGIDGRSGELLYYGPNIFGGYATGPEDLAVFRQPGVLHTGDIATRDEDGYYYITGRMKRFVKLYGTRINLDEVELFLKNAFPGKTLLCLDGGDRYLVICHTGGEPDGRALRQLIAGKLRLPPGIIKINILETIPLTPNGKTDYRAAESLLTGK